MEDCIIYNNNSGGSPDGDEENPWEWEELRNREWDRKLQEMSNMCSVELTNATVDRHDVPYLDEAFLQWFSCFKFVFHEERWRRFSVALQDAYSENVALIVEDTFEEQLKLEAILFSEAFPKQRQQLARGLLIQVWRGVAPKSAPWYAKSAQLIQDIDACCFMKRLIDARSMINCDPLLLPYNDVAAAVDGFINGYFEGTSYLLTARLSQMKPRGRLTWRVTSSTDYSLKVLFQLPSASTYPNVTKGS